MAKRYYWLKLKEDFFDSKRIKKLRRIAGGDTYTIIYLKMQLKAMKTDGVLTFDHVEDTFADELALDIDEEPENVQVTINYLLSYGLAETSDNVSFFLPYSIENTGSESSSAQRVRDYRDRLKSGESPKALHCNTCVTERRDREREDIELEIRGREEPPAPQQPLLMGVRNNISLSDEDIQRLEDSFPMEWRGVMDRLSEYLYKHPEARLNSSHCEKILTWCQQDQRAHQGPSGGYEETLAYIARLRQGAAN